MNTTRDTPLDPTVPALLVRYGNTSRTWRPLLRDVLLVGRSTRCDLGLESPEVGPIHCVLIRRADGWQVRDCGSHNGTRLNGKIIQEAPLRDGDVLQIGTFSFEARLPSPREDTIHPVGSRGTPELDQLRLESSRRRLAALALRLRSRLRQLSLIRNYPLTDQGLVGRETELNRQMAQLHERARTLDQRERRVKQAENDLEVDRETLDQEYAAFHARMERAEGELSRREADLDADLRARWTQCDERCREQERIHTERMEAKAAVAQEALQTQERILNLRQRELGHYARHLDRSTKKLIQQHLEAANKLAELVALREENARLKSLVMARDAAPSGAGDAKSWEGGTSTGLSAELAAWRDIAPKTDTHYPRKADVVLPLQL